MRGDLAERPLRFVIPETVKLAEPLVEIGLSVLPCGFDGDCDFPRTLDEFGRLARAVIEGVSLMGVSGLHRFCTK